MCKAKEPTDSLSSDTRLEYEPHAKKKRECKLSPVWSVISVVIMVI